jgi:hypothetical protein
MNTCLLGLETNVDRFTGALEGFLGRIQIDDGLRLVRDDRRIGLVSGDTVNVIDIDSTVSEPDRVGILMDISDDEAPSDHPIFVAGISTPSDTMGAVRMEMPTSQGQPPSELGNALPVPAPPAAAPEAGPAPQAAASGSQATRADSTAEWGTGSSPKSSPDSSPKSSPESNAGRDLGPPKADDSFAVPQQDSQVMGGGFFFVAHSLVTRGGRSPYVYSIFVTPKIIKIIL